MDEARIWKITNIHSLLVHVKELRKTLQPGQDGTWEGVLTEGTKRLRDGKFLQIDDMGAAPVKGGKAKAVSAPAPAPTSAPAPAPAQAPTPTPTPAPKVEAKPAPAPAPAPAPIEPVVVSPIEAKPTAAAAEPEVKKEAPAPKPAPKPAPRPAQRSKQARGKKR